MDNFNYYLWLAKTDKGDFFMATSGNWTEAEAAQKVLHVFKQLNLDIISMVPRKRATGPNETTGTIIQELEPASELGYTFLAGRKFWEICGRVAEYDAELVLMDKQMAEARDGAKGL